MDVRIKPPMVIKISTDAEGSTDKFNNNYQLIMTVQYISNKLSQQL